VLADRFDPRRLIQCGMGLFILASLGWGYFFLTDTIEVWQAMVPLLIHGCAGVRNAYNAQLPGFAEDVGHGNPGVAYSMLLAADAAGGLLAGVVLESIALLKPAPRTAIVLALFWCCALMCFAVSNIYPVALVLLFAAGFLELAFNAMAQALVQLNAHEEIRGRTIGLFNMASLGLRAFSGITVGLIGSIIGVHSSLALSALGLLAAACRGSTGSPRSSQRMAVSY
jgi:MFS family permease